MTSKKQRSAARANIRKAQLKWRSMSSRQHALAQPQGSGRKKPGTTGRGKYFRIVVRPKKQFTSFRMQDVGRKGHAIRLAGRRSSGSWDTEAWLISKKDAHIEDGHLVADDPNARKILSKQLSSRPTHVKGDIFRAKSKRNVPEYEKPTPAQRHAQHRNILKAQHARWH